MLKRCGIVLSDETRNALIAVGKIVTGGVNVLAGYWQQCGCPELPPAQRSGKPTTLLLSADLLDTLDASGVGLSETIAALVGWWEALGSPVIVGHIVYEARPRPINAA